MERRPTSLPLAMQGMWRDPDDGAELVVSGFDVTYRGVPVDHDWFEVSQTGGALSVALGVDAPEREDVFQRANVTGLVIDPEGSFHAFNVKFAPSFERVGP